MIFSASRLYIPRKTYCMGSVHNFDVCSEAQSHTLWVKIWANLEFSVIEFRACRGANDRSDVCWISLEAATYADLRPDYVHVMNVSKAGIFKMSMSVTKWAVRRIYQKDSLQFANYAKIESYLFHEKDDVTIKLEQEMAAPVTLT